MHNTPEETAEHGEHVRASTNGPDADDSAAGGGNLDVVPARRRAPFAENPEVGERGSRTQQRIVQAAMQVFADADYRSCRVEQISELAGCSRSSFYQYFSSKEDLFRQVAGELARSLRHVAAGDPITADHAGRSAIRDWLERVTELYESYAPMFSIFETVADMDDEVAERGEAVVATQARLLAARFADSAFESADAPAERVDVMMQLVPMVLRVHRSRSVQNARAEASGTAAIAPERLNEALTDVIHRTAFGPSPGVNVAPARTIDATPRASTAPRQRAVAPPSEGATGTRDRFIEVGTEVFVNKGYHDARVADVIDAAGTSHGTFYRYFEGKQALYREVAYRAGRNLVGVIERLPQVPVDRATLRRWAVEYIDVSAGTLPLTRTWIDASARDAKFRSVSLRAEEHVRARLAQFLEGRGFGDIDADSLALLALLLQSGRHYPWVAPGGRELSDLLVYLLERGFLEGR